MASNVYFINLLSALRRCLVILGATFVLASALSQPVEAQYRDRGGNQPGDFDYYTLSLSWSPTYCQTRRYNDGGEQCRGDRPYSFVLHGLWPQWYRGWPENCRMRERPWVPNRVINEMLDIMPSKGLIIHEYKTHGTCSGLSPENYFALARKLYESIRIPEMFTQAEAPVSVTPDEVERAFLNANPQLKPSMIAVSCQRDLVEEVRICFSRDGKPQDCGSNEDQHRICRADKLTMPPVRGNFSGQRL